MNAADKERSRRLREREDERRKIWFRKGAYYAIHYFGGHGFIGSPHANFADADRAAMRWLAGGKASPKRRALVVKVMAVRRGGREE